VNYSEIVVPACLPGGEHADYESASALTTAVRLDDLTRTEMPVILRGDRSCQMRLGPVLIDTDRQLCAFDAEFYNGATSVDYGSPLVIASSDERSKWIQVGVLSSTFGEFAIEFVRVARFLPWIKETIQNN
jgi:hypothetical protein